MCDVSQAFHQQLLHSNVDQGRSNGLAFGEKIHQTLFLDSKALAHLQLGATGPVSSVLLSGTSVSTRSHPAPHQSSRVIHKSLVWLTVVPPPASQTMTTSSRCENSVSASRRADLEDDQTSRFCLETQIAAASASVRVILQLCFDPSRPNPAARMRLSRVWIVPGLRHVVGTLNTHSTH
jgi:hypothetical protein